MEGGGMEGGGMEGGGRQFLDLGAGLAARVQVGCVTDS
jgi:hypothetical protein